MEYPKGPPMLGNPARLFVGLGFKVEGLGFRLFRVSGVEFDGSEFRALGGLGCTV